jgi:ferritin-like metal-binding protein YciE
VKLVIGAENLRTVSASDNGRGRQSRSAPYALDGQTIAEALARSALSQLQGNEVKAMGFFSKDIKTMDDLFIHTLSDIYYAEKQLVEALSTLSEKATNPQLKSAFEHHLAETRNQVGRVERVFEMHGAKPKTVHCPAIDGIIQEADDVSGEVDDECVLNAALIAAAQAAEHYEIARYGALISWAKQLGRNDCASLLSETLEEEKAADKILTNIAESKVNLEASLSR